MKKFIVVSACVLGLFSVTSRADDSWRISRLESEIYRLDAKDRDLQYDIWDLERKQEDMERRLQDLETKPVPADPTADVEEGE